MKKRIAVFASGGGTDFQSIIDANGKENFLRYKLLPYSVKKLCEGKIIKDGRQVTIV